MDVREISERETRLALPALKELRPNVASAAEVDALRPGGYRLAGSFDPGDEDAVCVAGFRITENIGNGRFLYVDDLVTRSAARSGGHGAAVLAWLEAEARSAGCARLQLDSGVHRFDAHRFYHRHGLVIAAHHFDRAL